jgi:LmbE family N-acetylglucosaminyl deacetylase
MPLGLTQFNSAGNHSVLVAISPHLDDVVLGCADLVGANRGALVVTVTAGVPPPHALTGWDQACGFGEGDDVVGARRREDEAALARLGAVPRWLDFLDRQYAGGASPDPPAVAAALADVIEGEGAGLVALPLGLQHPDHLATAAACHEVARQMPSVRWIVYEDAIYRRDAGATEQALRALGEAGFTLEALEVPRDGRKGEAVACYTSQLKGLGDLVQDAAGPERYWVLGSKR